MNLSKKALLKTGAPTPVRDAVQLKLPEIVEALDEGASQSAIYSTLREEGHNVGKGKSSFRNALKDLEGEIAKIRATTATPSVASPSPKPEDQSGISDGRYPKEWGDK